MGTRRDQQQQKSGSDIVRLNIQCRVQELDEPPEFTHLVSAGSGTSKVFATLIFSLERRGQARGEERERESSLLAEKLSQQCSDTRRRIDKKRISMEREEQKERERPASNNSYKHGQQEGESFRVALSVVFGAILREKKQERESLCLSL